MALGFSSCNDDNDELTDSRLTYYPVLEMAGDEVVEVPIGTTYVEAGCTATINGEDVPVEISGDVDSSTPGIYYVTYTATNSDGFSKSVERTVAVCDPSITTDISGAKVLQNGSHRNYGGTITGFDGYTVKITKAAPGIFYVDDMLGGWYRDRAGYGKSYAMAGYIQLLADNSIVALSALVPGWGDSYDEFEGSYDPATGNVTFEVAYAGVMTFTVILK